MSERIYTVGNMVKIPDTTLCCKHLNSCEIVFVGKMDYEPNVVAVSYFVQNIFPLLLPVFPDLKFIVVGAHPDMKVRRLKSDRVIITGFVDSVEPYFQNAAIVIAPMLTGAGIQNKITQAMSYGCCVATTSIGAEGLSIRNNEIAIFNDDQSWVDGLSSLLINFDRRVKMGLAARDYVIRNLSYENIEKQFWLFVDGK